MHVFKYSGSRSPTRFILFGDRAIVWNSKTGIVSDIDLEQPESSQCQLTGEPLPYTMIVSADVVADFCDIDFQQLPLEITERLNILNGRDSYTVEQWLQYVSRRDHNNVEELGKIFIALGQTILDTGAADFPTIMSSVHHRSVFHDRLRDSGLEDADVFSILEQAGFA